MDFNFDKHSNGRKIIIAAAILFFFGVLVLAKASPIFISPDETANMFFIENMQNNQSLKFQEPVNERFNDTIHPRSIVSYEAHLVPAGFLGLPVIFGAIATLTNGAGVPIFMASFALIGAWAFFRIVKEVSPKHAIVATMLFLFHPAWIYYTARSLMPNVLFVSLLLLSIAFALTKPTRIPKLNNAFSGLFLASALFVRPSEVWWVAVCCLLIALYYFRKKTIMSWSFWGIGLLFGIQFIFLWNFLTYGHPLLTGYTLPFSNEGSVVTVSTSSTLFPFGIHLRSAWSRFVDYGIGMFWWISTPTVLGVLLFAKEKIKEKRAQIIFLLFAVITIWLALYYGSWAISDNPDPSQITIANSYVRYWIPIFVFSSLFAAVLLQEISEKFKNKWERVVLGMLVAVLLILNVQAAYLRGQDGLLNVSSTLDRSLEIQGEVLLKVPEDGVIITDRSDKLFFPHRNVIYPFRSESTQYQLKEMEEEFPLYYFGITLPQDDMDYLNNRKLKEKDLQIIRIETFDQESLYKITSS